jgi:hypothetical protein
MSTFVRSALAAAVSVALAAPAAATVLTFDDIGPAAAVPSNYGGLDWSAGAWSFYGQPQPPYTPHSAPFFAYTGQGIPDASTAIRFPTPATFKGAWFAGYDVATVTFQLYLGGSLVHTSATLSPSDTSTFLASGFSGVVDTVIVSSPFQAFYAMDDFTFEPGVVVGVPEPETSALMLVGLGAIGWLARRRKA